MLKTYTIFVLRKILKTSPQRFSAYQSFFRHRKEQHLYGSSRLGVFETGVKLDTTTKLPYYVENNVTISGKRLYELSNHLGNVLTVIRDYTYPVGNRGLATNRVKSAKILTFDLK